MRFRLVTLNIIKFPINSNVIMLIAFFVVLNDEMIKRVINHQNIGPDELLQGYTFLISSFRKLGGRQKRESGFVTFFKVYLKLLVTAIFLSIVLGKLQWNELDDYINFIGTFTIGIVAVTLIFYISHWIYKKIFEK